MKTFGTMAVDAAHHLTIGGIDVTTLANQYGTPLYIMDRQLIETQMQAVKSAFVSPDFDTDVLYASKAFLTRAMCQLVAKYGLSLDVVSGGELYTAVSAGFPMSQVYFHGNFKTDAELTLALTHDVGTIVLDSADEYRRLSALLAPTDRVQSVLLRVNPGIEAHTHAYIRTAKHSSKFGESLYAPETLDLIETLHRDPHIAFKGLHCHIGSQIFDIDSYLKAVDVMLDYLATVTTRLDRTPEVLNIGGGFGVFYSDGDDALDLETAAAALLSAVEKGCAARKLSLKKLLIEPGRSLVANAGVTLYTASAVKTTYSGKRYVFVDGGMTDNLRPALYGAVYEAALANAFDAVATENVTLAGSCCESGDVLIKEALLPPVKAGDLVVVGSTGAYTYSMASHYNKRPKPAVVMVKDGRHQCIAKRETYDDLLRGDCLLNDID